MAAAISCTVPLFLTALLLSLLARFLCLAIYRLYFHPLRKFPGPKLAICTYLYEQYYEVIKQGQYTFKLRELHEKYGSVIRLNPDELHCNDPDFYHEIYSGVGAKVEKAQFFRDAFGPLEMTFDTVDHDLHRLRRGALNVHFTKRSVTRLSSHIHATIQHLCQRFEQALETGESITLQNAYAALTADIIYEYCFATSQNTLSIPNYDAEGQENMVTFLKQLCISFQFPIIPKVLFSLPDAVLKVLSPGYGKVLDDQNKLSAQIEAIKASDQKGRFSSSRTTVFHALLNSNLPPAEKSTLRLRDEAFSLIIGSTTTVAHTLKIITYHLLSSPPIHTALFSELTHLMPHPSSTIPPLATFEQSPYLTATILEGLRHSHGLTHRLWRSFPQKTLYYNGLAIPPRTNISATALLLHENPNNFPDFSTFRPERWLGEGQDKGKVGVKLKRYLVPFSRGTRRCVGENLAWAEMYATLAVVVRRFEMILHDVVKERDVDIVRDAFVPLAKGESRGICIKVVGLKR